MVSDSYSAVWVSYSSMSTFMNCPRAYYLSSVYKDPSTGKKISIISPALALGQAIHEVVESLSVVPVEERFIKPLSDTFEKVWRKVHGEKGGFRNEKEEELYKDRGRKMLSRVINEPGPLKKLAVKIRMDLPHYWLSEEEGIILCGKIDWLEYLPDVDGVNIIDFKTGKNREKLDSLQLPIYMLLVKNTQQRKVERMSYWYLEYDNEPVEVDMFDEVKANKQVLEIAKKIKLHRKLDKFDCPKNGCMHCKPFEQIIEGRAKLVGTNDFGSSVYVVNMKKGEIESDIL